MKHRNDTVVSCQCTLAMALCCDPELICTRRVMILLHWQPPTSRACHEPSTHDTKGSRAKCLQGQAPWSVGSKVAERSLDQLHWFAHVRVTWRTGSARKALPGG